MTTKNYTKDRIKRLLVQKSKRLIDISREMRLAPSTVNQHLQDMLAEGSIRLAWNGRHFKYYEVVEYA